MTIEPSEAAPGSTPVSVDGVTLDAPATWHSDRQVHGAITLVRLFDPEHQNPAVVLTVGPQPAANATAVGVALDSVARQWKDLSHDVARTPVAWTGVPHAAALTFRYDDPDGVTGQRDAMFVGAHSPDRTTVVIVGVMPQDGRLEDSAGYDVLRTLHFE